MAQTAPTPPMPNLSPATATEREVDAASPGLHASPAEPLPFARSLDTRAFLLERDQGNVLIYSTGAIDANPDWLPRHGGAARRYLGHGHEAMFASHVEAPLFVHRADAEAVRRTMPVRATFTRRHLLDDDLEVIPIPGHTPGSTAYLWESDGRRYLFTADSIYLVRDEWRAALLDSSDRDAYVRSLELLRGLEFDVLVPWAATGGEPYVAPTDREDSARRIGRIIERIRAGRRG